MKEINEKIHMAAEEILMEGAWPTVCTIREKLGTGSNTTINNELKSWRIAFLNKLKKAKSRPNCPEILTNATDKLWAIACEEAELVFESKRKDLIEKENDLLCYLKKIEHEKNEKELLIQDIKNKLDLEISKNNKMTLELEEEKKSNQKNQIKLKELNLKFLIAQQKNEELSCFYKIELQNIKNEEGIKLAKANLESKEREEIAYQRLEGLRAHIYEQVQNERKIFIEEKLNLENKLVKLEKKNEDLTKEIKALSYEKGVVEAEKNTLKKDLQKTKKSKFILNRKRNEL